VTFAAVILAGERPGGGKFSRELGLPASVLVDLAGKPALQRVVEALHGASSVAGGLVCGPAAEVWDAHPELARLLADAGFAWRAPGSGPSASALAAVRELAAYPLLLTAGDHALLTPGIVDDFCRAALRAGGDAVVGLAPYRLVRSAFPDSRRTVQTYRDGAFCGTNLYALLNPRGLAALAFWQSVESWRKTPWKIAAALGPVFLARYLLRRVTLAQALARLSAVSGCRVTHVLVDAARAAVDVDSLADRDLAERILQADSTG
jgi:GTP:adenosylcobinamide-phosphate guanylyltransferase